MEKLPKKPVWKRPLVIVSSCIILLVALFAGAEVWLGIKIRRTVEQQVAELTKGACRIEIQGARFNIFNRSIRLRGITLRSDSSLLAAKGSSLAKLTIDAEELFIKGIRLRNRDGARTLSLSLLALQSPQITFVRDPAHKPSPTAADTQTPPDSASRSPLASLQQKMAGVLQELSIDRFALLNGTVDYCELRDGKRLCHGIRGISVETNQLHLDASEGTPDSSFFDGDIRLSLGGLNYLFNQGAVKLEADTLHVDTRARLLSLSGVRLLPQYPKEVFASLTRNHADWTQVITDKITCSGFDFQDLLQNKVLRADSVGIHGVQLASYKNRQIAQPPRIKPLFYQTLQKMALGVDIGRIRFDSVDVTYQELSPDGIHPGTITFNRLSGDFDGLTNIPSTEQPYFTIRAQGLLMNRGAVQATFSLPVDSSNNRFEVTGTLGAFSMTRLNQITEPLVNLKVDSGKINGMSFRIDGGAEHSSVTMTLLYDDLYVMLIKDANGQIKERKFLSAVIDKLVLKHANPDNRGTRIGQGTAARDPHRSQFNYLWKSLLPGVKSTLMGRNTERLERKDKREHKEFL